MSSDPPSSPVRAGQVVAGKYRVGRTLGAGGMGVVVAATHLSLDQCVALKFLRAESREDEENVERFTREARAAAKIQSEHVCRVMDAGRIDSGDLYMVMEYLEGRDLADILASDGAFSPVRAVQLVLQACEAIAEAHAHGIVHRDLKPANLFLADRVDGSTTIKVLDFGISKVTLSRMSMAGFSTDPSLTHPTAIMGSPLYMSPEQMHASVQVDARTDIWAIGVVLYELVSGRTPFEDESVPLIYAAILNNDPPPLAGRVKRLPAKLESIIRRCLEKDPAKRYADVADLVADLAPIAPNQGRRTMDRVGRLKAVRSASERPPRLITPPDPNAPLSTSTSWEHRPSSIGAGRIVAIGAALFAIGATAAVLVAQARRNEGVGGAPARDVATAGTSAPLYEPPPAQEPPDASAPAIAPAASTEPPPAPAASAGPLVAPASSTAAFVQRAASASASASPRPSVPAKGLLRTDRGPGLAQVFPSAAPSGPPPMPPPDSTVAPPHPQDDSSDFGDRE